MTSRTRRAFTLIELLVVIAIIAILAAILFPVFAKAREAARGASSQSNIKQLTLANLMYVQDYDETYAPFMQWGAGPIQSGGVRFSTWAYDVAPYIKNVQIFADPLYGPLGQADVLAPFYTDYGYDYTVMSPYTGNFGTTPWIFSTASLAAINRPAETVLVGGRFDEKEIGGLFWYGSGTMFTQGGIEPPDCSDISAWCFSDWAPDGNYSGLTEVAGLYTGGDSVRKAGTANFGMADGHAKFMQPGNAAVGTNWFKGAKAGTIHITNPSIYMWEQSP